MQKHIGLILWGIAIGNQLFAQNIDSSFGTNGIVKTDISASGDGINAIAIQNDGKIVAVGFANNGTNNDFAIARYEANGNLDPSFDTDGKLTTPIGAGGDVARSVAVQQDGKIVAAGWAGTGNANDFALTRYQPNGTLDNNFGTGGKITTAIGAGDERVNAIIIQPDGKIVAAGFSNNGAKDNIALARYKVNGTLDETFGTNGLVTTSVGTSNDRAFTVVTQPDGKILVAGYSNTATGSAFVVARYDSNGALDNGFGVGGKTTTSIGLGADVANAIALQPDGKIVLGGYSFAGSNALFAVVRYNSNGIIDNSFSIDGIVTTPIGSGSSFGNSIILQPDGKVVLVGYSEASTTSSKFALARYNSIGTLDGTFGTNGIITTILGANRDEAYSAKLQNGKVVVAGRSNNGTNNDFALARYSLGLVGTNHAFIGNGTLKIYPNPILDSATLEYVLREDKTISIYLTDIQGKVVQTFLENQRQKSGDQKLHLDFAERLITGDYFVVISSVHGQVSIKVVK